MSLESWETFIMTLRNKSFGEIVYERHPQLDLPDEDDRIWRYMSLSKFISVLDKKALYFTRSDKLNDKFEGSYSKFNIENRPNVYKGDGSEKLLKIIPSLTKDMRRHFFINCWHLNHYESAAMWNIYTKSNESIAIQSTFNRLKESFNSSQEEIFISKVKYVDYETYWIPEGNILYPFVHKMKFFEYENELRAIYYKIPENEEGQIAPSQEALYKNGIDINIAVNKLIENIYISPLADEWFYNLIKSIVLKFNFDFNIKKSNLDNTPLY